MVRFKGFSIIELLSVIVILSVLIALLSPTISAAKMRAKSESAKSNLRNVWLAIKMYQEEYGGEVHAFESWESENLPKADLAALVTHGWIPKDQSRQSPCGVMPGFGPLPAIWYMHDREDGADNLNIQNNQLRTVVAVDPQCNSNPGDPQKQFWSKRAIGVTIDGQLLDRTSDRWQFWQPIFFGNK